MVLNVFLDELQNLKRKCSWKHFLWMLVLHDSTYTVNVLIRVDVSSDQNINLNPKPANRTCFLDTPKGTMN